MLIDYNLNNANRLKNLVDNDLALEERNRFSCLRDYTFNASKIINERLRECHNKIK